jgi:lysine biosynthesis protein LysW
MRRKIMTLCECPGCQITIDIANFDEMAIIECPKCRMHLEVVSIDPPIVEEALDEISREWEE